jgi:hypothetical protein
LWKLLLFALNKDKVLLDRSFPQCFTVGDLLDDSMVLQLLPAGLKSAGLDLMSVRDIRR